MKPDEHLKVALDKLSKAPLKPQQRLFALRVVVLPSLYHLIVMDNTTLSRLKKVDSLVHSAVKKWLNLPHDTPTAYFNTNHKDCGLSIPAVRWLVPLKRKERFVKLAKGLSSTDTSVGDPENRSTAY